MNKLKVGFAALNIDPEMGISIAGYYVPRFAKGVLDSLFVQAMALECDGVSAVVISFDCIGINEDQIQDISKRIEAAAGIPQSNVYITATHTHTAPFLTVAVSDTPDAKSSKIIAYRNYIADRAVEATVLAVQDLAPAVMGYGVCRAPERIAYIRRFRMKDGSIMTCPPVNDPNIDHPIGELDPLINILRFKREQKRDVVLVNYGVHADTTNGDLISADWPGWMRNTVDLALSGVDCIFLQGAEGDVGSTNVHPVPSDMNDTEISFDNEMKSPGMARFVGRAMAGAVLQVFDKVEFMDVERIGVVRKKLQVPANKPAPEDMPRAREYKRLHEEGRDDLIPYTGMELTTVVAEALQMCNMENGPDHFSFELTGLCLGNVAFAGIPGEPFTEIGVMIKDTPGWNMILPTALTNGNAGYFPMRSAFSEGGYEARSSKYTAEVADLVVQCAKEILSELKEYC